MRLLVVVTTPRYPLWKATDRPGWETAEVLAETEVRVRRVGQDAVLVFCQSDLSEIESESEREEEDRERTTPWVIEAANSPEYAAAEKVYVAAHEGYVAAEWVRGAIPAERLSACVPFIHEPGRPPFDDLLKLFTRPDPEAFDAALDAVKKKQELTHAQRLTTLKHRLARLFLPVSVDLQGWREFEYDDEYMDELLSSYGRDEGRLERARELLYERGRPAGAETVERLVTELGLEGSGAWGRVQSLLPPQEPAREELPGMPLYAEVFRVKDVLGSLREKGALHRLKGALEAGDDSFNEWYLALEAALAELRGEMEKRRRD